MGHTEKRPKILGQLSVENHFLVVIVMIIRVQKV